MDFPDIGFVRALQAHLNEDAAFNAASRWSDVKVVLGFGDQRYWLKLYGGKIIDLMVWFPMANPLGWDYSITAPLATWQALRDGSRVLGHLLDRGEIAVDGDLLQANRLYESTHLMLSAVRDLKR
ncbi:MAG: hypothetical protein HY749_14540 [Gammaproteobacteria bacterium]|nr:hypothetical protein [Gammaproteobacteria bacterium]MBI5618457.1 hypothetical protein [Gammaproteobacteria bacterium]